MFTRRALLAQVAAYRILWGQSSSATRPDPLEKLKTTHPRLIVPDNELPRIQAVTQTYPLARKLRDNLVREADRILIAPPVEYKLVGPRLLAQSRRVLDRIYTLALLHRLDGQPQYLERAIKELRAAALFPDWNPQHFLDVAEMTHAFAIAYDWLYPVLNEAQRDWVATAMVQKGLDPGLTGYKEQASWCTVTHSWNIVCNAGLAIGALAVADREPERARRVLNGAFDSLPRALATFGPDGGWPEGPGYWNYTVRYLVSLVASLESSLDNDHQLAEARGVQQTGRFRIYGLSPTNKVFNFADNFEDPGSAPEMFWLARRFNQPVYAWHEQMECERTGRADALDIAWFYKDVRPPVGPDWPNDALFTGVQVATLRSSADDPNAIYLGVKGGDNKVYHAHLDLGSFVLDAGGVRWSYDPGPEDYSVPGYFGIKRFTYFKTKTEAHSTVLLDGENQDRRGEARITRHEFGPDLSWVQIDLSRAYPTGKVKAFQRRIGIVQKQGVMIEDTLQADQPVDVLWGMMTQADVVVNGQTALLRKNDWNLACEIRSPHHAVFDVLEIQNTRKLVVRLGTKVTSMDLTVVLTPYRSGQAKPALTKRFPD